jgi:apolipoprotein N-acyltransferase
MEDEITQYAIETGHYALIGVGTRVKRLKADRLRGPIQRHNSAVLLAPDGTDMAWYDKNRLVPFGEYIPKKHWLQLFSKKPIKGTLNFEPSGRFTLMPFPPAPFAVFICYEAVYPSTVRRLTNLGARFLVTITNDAWFGATSAPYQHWDQVAIRAIENRRWVARAANTGISGFIDPLGRTVVATPIYVDAKAVGTVRPLDVRTLYSRIGDGVAYACIAVYWTLLGYALWRQKFRKEKAA